MEKLHRIYVNVTLVRASSFRVDSDPQTLIAGRYYLAFQRLAVVHAPARGVETEGKEGEQVQGGGEGYTHHHA